MARLYSDEDLSYPVVEELRKLGHDVLTAQEAGQANHGVTDSAVLALAIAGDRALFTFNRRPFIENVPIFRAPGSLSPSASAW
jgi:hypothetical protein